MSKQIYCQKLKQYGEQLTKAPLAGELGQKIYQNICTAAWQLWLEQQTMLINENRLSLVDQQSKIFLKEECEKFLFSNTSTTPEGFIAPSKEN
jgi:Fe-S cluster biosynthesis and repair protein YggX